MPRFIDADKLMENFATATKKFMADKYFSNVKDVKNYIRLIRDVIIEQPTADVVDRAKYKQLLENSTIMADALKEYERQEEENE